MKCVAIKEVQIASIRLDGEFTHRLDTERVLFLAKSIKRTDGPIFEPGIREKSYKVIYGRDRIAAAIRAGQTSVRCKIWRCSDEEARELEIAENAHRRHEPDKARAELMQMLELYEQQLSVDPGQEVTLADGTLGRARTVRGLARQKLAAERGVKPDSVRKAEYRAANARNMRERSKEAKAEREQKRQQPEIITIGMEVESEFAVQTNRIRQLLWQASGKLNVAQAFLTDIERESLPFPLVPLQRMKEELHRLAAELKRAMPATLCPYCKGLPGIQERCAGCYQQGWIDSGKAEHVPKELWQEGDKAVVYHQGRPTPIADLFETPSQPEPVVEADDMADLFA